ncbi:DUF4168 domain-containing protein [Brasilonema sp. UFV-L1]|uniref:DUF4168 domain-containing protein n=1 Tax=Brasilonema sp. UFV-L1 TaxID=2234130 RepID=UPI00145D0C2A|nr:DUF4168 domain-containing protein [Brasilonema sp. UFV-L1]NMG07952.1 hypothetical protein [Brasilonema sp. UFV-L1]
MKRYYHRFVRLSLIRMLSQSLFVGTIATVSLVSNAFILSSKIDAQAQQTVNSGELRNYARAMLKMEPERQQAFDEIKKIMGSSEVPKIVCNDNNSLNGLPGKAKEIAVNYCKRYQTVAQENGLDTDKFNMITQQLQSNKDLERKMFNMLICLQKNPECGK